MAVPTKVRGLGGGGGKGGGGGQGRGGGEGRWEVWQRQGGGPGEGNEERKGERRWRVKRGRTSKLVSEGPLF